MNEIYVTETLPIIALRGLSVFPEMTMHFDVGREKSVRALDEAMRERQYVFPVSYTHLDVYKRQWETTEMSRQTAAMVPSAWWMNGGYWAG